MVSEFVGNTLQVCLVLILHVIVTGCYYLWLPPVEGDPTAKVHCIGNDSHRLSVMRSIDFSDSAKMERLSIG